MDAQELAKAALSFLEARGANYPHGIARAKLDRPDAQVRQQLRLLALSAPVEEQDRILFKNLLIQGLKCQEREGLLLETGCSAQALAEAREQYSAHCIVVFGSELSQAGVLVAPTLAELRTNLQSKKKFWLDLKTIFEKPTAA
ncbi:MAG: hypothetical protein K1X79_12965 [Oligoflexia bacterium]|nr:hypothetical protein [Oligoflexia bacterium]